MYKIFIVVNLFFFTSAFAEITDSTSNKPVKIYGVITVEKNKPLEGANLVIQGSIDGATSDSKEYYEFETEKTGKQILIITALEYSEKKTDIDIIPYTDMKLDFGMSKAEVTTDEIVVTASSFTSGKNSQVTITALEIVRIPGANADLFRALTTFPGTNQVDEGSRITVRGGDPDEVLTILDQASLYNPFIFDNTYNTSSFSTINPWSLKGINFSSGGFSAKYGNALSAVLDLNTYDVPQTRGMFAILGLANAGLSGSYVNKKGDFGATFSGSQTFLRPFIEVNGTRADFSPLPTATQLGGTISHKFSSTGLIKFYIDYNSDNIGIKSYSPTYEGYFNNKTNNIFANLMVQTAPSAVSLLNVSVSASRYNRIFNYGVLSNDNSDIYSKIRADFSTPLSQTMDFRTGAEFEYSEFKLSGTYPQYFYNIRPDAPSVKIDGKNNTGRLGAYVESQAKFGKYLFVIGGLRSDYHTLSNKYSIDPRLSLVYKLSNFSFLKGATGIYHQFSSLQNYQLSYNFTPEPQKAVHYILGYEYNRDGDYILRVETYYKDYSNLLSRNEYGYLFNSGGEGFAKGVDAFFKVRFKPDFNGWISYSYTDSKRRLFPTQPLVSSNYDITHNVSIVASYNITSMITVGASYRISTGKPYTPVTSAIYDPTQNAYEPAYGTENSERFSVYQRVDLNAQYIFSLFNKFAVVFVALNNLFNTDNLYSYTYNFNYTNKLPVYSDNTRIIYAGIGMQL
ncbi:TonB-dependent receptor [bacterium]|nr:MAG: TonB-dependent receptor [bacterium]